MTMAEEIKLNHPRLVAVWPGMGNVALNAGIYLLAKLNMTLMAELSTTEFFDAEHVEVKNGILTLGRRPRHRFFVWHDPQGKQDLVVFVGEAQPPLGKYAFCRQLIEFARQLGVERVYTFAAMATEMHPAHDSRVFIAATNETSLGEWTGQKLEVLEDGHVGGLNGILLGVAKELGLQGACLLGEMPHIFSQVPFPKASLAILRLFCQVIGIEIDFAELAQQADATGEHLGQLLAQVEAAYEKESEAEADEEAYPAEPQEDEIDHMERQRIEELFSEAAHDRSKAFELKSELDRLEVFKEFEDRFLDLFQKP